MVQGEALGADVIGALEAVRPGWAGPWRAGVRPGLGARAGADERAARAETERGSKIR
ncbi:hypothetical protein MOK15_07075 [Sphingobium sp. BYY-5]|uniref:hypothetical protein n=1 Tax=Sphingobium sp. BYY-5 TaxID=2926400 RepID=UPI001FA6F26A|nr:hypothetical protein [Sphingobium sp. BYY-5]MCI4589851.1 hypothetical protein [Sphingobium sp. BYY-5]